MSSDEEIEHLFLNIITLYAKKKKIKCRRRWRVRPINMDWFQNGYHRKTFLKIKDMDEQELFSHTRMPRQLYDVFVKLIAPSLCKLKETIHAEERISLTLLYLAYGTPIKTLAWSYKIAKTTTRNIILETCDTIWKVLSTIYLSEPTQQQYKDITIDFGQMWNMPNCVGAIDGKHIAIKCPPKSGSMYFNYKKFFSIVLLAACDAKYTFTAISVGAYGSDSDGGIFNVTRFGKDLLENRLPLPPDTPLPLTLQPFPHYFVGDCAFPLKNNLIKPFPGVNTTKEERIFNYRLSRARRVIENAFGILTARWRVLRTTLEFHPENAEKIVLACLVLHNFIMLNDTDRWYCPENYTEEGGSATWRNELRPYGGPLRSVQTFKRRGRNSAYDYRLYLTNYFMNEGAVVFQNHIE